MEWNENDDEAIFVRNRICCVIKVLVLNKILCTLRHFQSCRIGGMHSDKRNTCEFQIRKFIPKIDRLIHSFVDSFSISHSCGVIFDGSDGRVFFNSRVVRESEGFTLNQIIFANPKNSFSFFIFKFWVFDNGNFSHPTTIILFVHPPLQL